jgi:hypothetical protein
MEKAGGGRLAPSLSSLSRPTFHSVDRIYSLLVIETNKLSANHLHYIIYSEPSKHLSKRSLTSGLEESETILS